MAEVGGLTLFGGVVGLVDDDIQVASQDTGIHPKLFEVESAIFDKSWESQRPEVADRRLLRTGVLDDFRAIPCEDSIEDSGMIDGFIETKRIITAVAVDHLYNSDKLFCRTLRLASCPSQTIRPESESG